MPKLVKVQFWISPELRTELNDFAHGLCLSTADLYKAGALMLKNSIEQGQRVTINMFTRSFKDFENTQIQKKILKAQRESRSVY